MSKEHYQTGMISWSHPKLCHGSLPFRSKMMLWMRMWQGYLQIITLWILPLPVLFVTVPTHQKDSGSGFELELNCCNGICHWKNQECCFRADFHLKHRHSKASVFHPSRLLSSNRIVTTSICKLPTIRSSFCRWFPKPNQRNICWVSVEIQWLEHHYERNFDWTPRISNWLQLAD